jgi:hypothetical protein
LDWHAEVELAAELAPDQLDEVADGFRTAYYNSADKVLRLGDALAAVEYAAAVDEARGWVQRAAVPAVHRYAADAQVVRVVIESAAARAARWAVGTKEAAELLGITPARVRQLEGEEAFPKPIAELAGGAVRRADEVETFGRRRVRSKGGRPRKDG